MLSCDRQAAPVGLTIAPGASTPWGVFSLITRVIIAQVFSYAKSASSLSHPCFWARFARSGRRLMQLSRYSEMLLKWDKV